MPIISGESGVPLGRSGTGAAYVLGTTTPDPLSIMLQGERNRALARQRAEAAQQKAREEDLRRFTTLLSSVKDDTGLTYQGQHMAEREQVGQEFMKTALDPSVSPQQKQLVLDGIKTRYEQRGLLGKQIDDTVKAAAEKARPDKELDWEKVTKHLHGLQYGEDGSVLPVDKFPLRKMDDVLEDPSLYNTGAIYDNFVNTKVAPKEIYQQAAGGRPGTFARSYTDEIRFYKRNADGSLYRDPKTHKPRVEITPELLEKAMEHPRIKRDLEGLMGAHQALTASAEQKMANREQLTPEERSAIDVDPTMADLLGRRLGSYGYANHRETQRYVKVPQPRTSASGGDYDIPSEALTFEGEGRYNLTTQAGDAPYFNAQRLVGGQRIGFETGPMPTHQDFATYGQPLPQPMFRKKSGQLTEIEIEGFTPPEVMQKGADGISRSTKYNGQTMSGKFGPAVPVFTDSNGVLLPVQSRAEGEALVRAGKANLRLQFDFHQRTNKNYAADVKDLANKLLTDRDDATGRPKYHSFQEAEAVAQKRLSGGLERVPVLYTERTQAVVDRAAGPLYRKQNEALMAEQRRLRAEGPRTPTAKVKADPLGFGDTQLASRPKADPLGFGNTGGLYTRPKRPSLLQSLKPR
jgi:hypothetical protein